MSDYLSREEILTADDLGEEDVDCPEWGGKVRIRGMSEAKRQHISKTATINGEIDSEKLARLLFIHGVINPEFDDSDYEALGKKSSAALQRVVVSVLKINGQGVEDAEETASTFLGSDKVRDIGPTDSVSSPGIANSRPAKNATVKGAA